MSLCYTRADRERMDMNAARGLMSGAHILLKCSLSLCRLSRPEKQAKARLRRKLMLAIRFISLSICPLDLNPSLSL